MSISCWKWKLYTSGFRCYQAIEVSVCQVFIPHSQISLWSHDNSEPQKRKQVFNEKLWSYQWLVVHRRALLWRASWRFHIVIYTMDRWRYTMISFWLVPTASKHSFDALNLAVTSHLLRWWRGHPLMQFSLRVDHPEIRDYQRSRTFSERHQKLPYSRSGSERHSHCRHWDTSAKWCGSRFSNTDASYFEPVRPSEYYSISPMDLVIGEGIRLLLRAVSMMKMSNVDSIHLKINDSDKLLAKIR